MKYPLTHRGGTAKIRVPVFDDFYNFEYGNRFRDLSAAFLVLILRLSSSEYK
jgi:hypothetical protein